MAEAWSTTLVVISIATLIVFSIGAWALTLFGLPGNWIMAGVALLYDLLAKDGTRPELGTTVVVSLFVLAAVGEALEFLAGALGAARKGGSRRGAVYALIGSTIGGVLGAVVGLPVPVVGSVLGVVIFAGIGALLGAVLGEIQHGQELSTSVDIGVAAFWGRLLGSLAKTLVGGVMLAVIVVGLFM